jgi:hypothetical protein
VAPGAGRSGRAHRAGLIHGTVLPEHVMQFVQRRNGRTSTPGLTIAGTGTIIFLGFFSRKAIRQACLARGWRVSDQTTRQG